MLDDSYKILTEGLPKIPDVVFHDVLDHAARLVRTFSEELKENEAVEESSEDVVYGTLDAIALVLEEAQLRFIRRAQ